MYVATYNFVSVYLDQISHTYACQRCSITDILMEKALLSISPANHGQLVKMHIILEPHCIFGSNCILIYFKSVQPLVCKR